MKYFKKCAPPISSLVALLPILLSGCSGGGPIVTPPVGTIGYTLLSGSFFGASISGRSGRGATSNIRIEQNFNEADYVTVWLPGDPSLGVHLTSNTPDGHYFVRLEVTNVDEDDDGRFNSTTGGGTIEITSITAPSLGQRGHITGTFSSVVRNSFFVSVIISQGTFDCDFDPGQ